MLQVLFAKGFQADDYNSSSVDVPMENYGSMPASLSYMHLATLNNDPKMVGILLDGGVSMYEKKMQFYTPYDLAVAMGFEEVKTVMEQKTKEDLHSCVKWKYGPFNALFCLKGIYRPDLIKKLAKQGHDFDEAYDGHTKPIYFAIRCQDNDSLKILIELGADPDPNWTNRGKLQKSICDSPLGCAARLGNVGAVKVLLSENVHIGDIQIYCCKDLEIFKMMVASGALVLKHGQRWKRMRELSMLHKLKSLQNFIETEFDAPPLLTSLCRNSMRQHFSRRAIHRFVDMQCLPTRIRKYLLLTDELL